MLLPVLLVRYLIILLNSFPFSYGIFIVLLSHFPAPIDDLARGIKEIFDNIQKYPIDPSDYSIWGFQLDILLHLLEWKLWDIRSIIYQNQMRKHHPSFNSLNLDGK